MANADAHAQLGDQARNMRLAMESRAVIEQAKGVLMAQRHVDADQAFEILREASQRYNRKLRDIALGIVESTQARPRPLTAPASAASREASRETRNSTAAALSTRLGDVDRRRRAETARRSTSVWPRPAPRLVSTTTSRRTVPSVPGTIASVSARASWTTTPAPP